MTVDPGLQAFLDQINAAPRSSPTVEERREGIRGLIAHLNQGRPAVADVDVRDIVIGAPDGIAARHFAPSGRARDQLPLIVFFHGGGWVIGDLDTHARFCATLAAKTGMQLLAIDYRLAPEHRFPAAQDDAIAALRWVADGGLPYRADGLFVAGDSAGATMATVAARQLRGEAPAIHGQILICPTTDIAGDHASRHGFAEGYLLSEDEIAFCREQYVPDGFSAGDDRISPLLAADLTAMPPALLVVAEYDPLRDEGIAYAEKLRLQGSPVKLLDLPGMIHGFNLLDALSPGVAAALERLCTELLAYLAPSSKEISHP